jgi:tripartite-type tricarboxylate transporter receptor subunit TctC
MEINRRTFTVGAALAGLMPAPAIAQTFNRDITMVVPWAAGGGTDTLARTLAKNAKQHIGVNVNVVNRTGGTGAVGMQSVSTARPDGYTVGLVTFHLSAYRLMGLSQLSYRDFQPIALLNRTPAAFSVKADSPFKTLKDMVEYAKANPGVVTVANSGAGATTHLSAAVLAKNNGIKFSFVPFDGGAPARTAMVGGHVSSLVSGPDEVLQYVKTGQVRLLAMVGETRHSSFPDVPTVAEAGYPMKDVIYDWRGIAGPKNLPPEITKALVDGFAKMANDPEFIALMEQVALQRVYMNGEDFGKFLGEMEVSLEPALAEVGLLKK